MTVDPEEILDLRPPAPSELAEFVKIMRDMNKWSQETLAEIPGLTDRTIQRVEKGEPVSLDTRRALASAFGYQDLDIFEKPWPFPNVEKLKEYTAEIERTTVVVKLTRIDQGSTLRRMIEGAHSSSTEEIGCASDDAREAFAASVDYLRDYNDLRYEFSMSQRLEVDRDIDAFLSTIAEEGAIVGAGLRHARLRSKDRDTDRTPMDWTNIHFVLAPKDELPSEIRMAKEVRFG